MSPASLTRVTSATHRARTLAVAASVVAASALAARAARAEGPDRADRAAPASPDPSPASGATGPRPAARRPHGSLAAGGALLLTGDRGDRARLELSADLKLGSRFGALAAWRAPDEHHRGLVTAGLVFEAGAARPRLVLDLHADLGVDLDAGAPLAGGGIRTTLGIAGPLGVVLDTGGYLVVDGIADTRLQLQSSALLALHW